jgi:hypothetical protein
MEIRKTGSKRANERRRGTCANQGNSFARSENPYWRGVGNPESASLSYQTGCGAIVQLSGRTLAHLQAHPEVFPLLPEAIAGIHTNGNVKLEVEVDLGRVVGTTTRVETTPILATEQALFAIRDGRAHPIRVADPGAIGQPTKYVTVIAAPTSQGIYRLLTAWVGTRAAKEPWDPSIRTQVEFDDCLRFWSSNALLHDSTMGHPFTSTWQEVLSTANVGSLNFRID